MFTAAWRLGAGEESGFLPYTASRTETFNSSPPVVVPLRRRPLAGMLSKTTSEASVKDTHFDAAFRIRSIAINTSWMRLNKLLFSIVGLWRPLSLARAKLTVHGWQSFFDQLLVQHSQWVVRVWFEYLALRGARVTGAIENTAGSARLTFVLDVHARSKTWGSSKPKQRSRGHEYGGSGDHRRQGVLRARVYHADSAHQWL